ncbi:MAG: outer membrane beta-barrel protein [Bacteroidales bacterium]|nr:outer membrane beta-barrel protein [Bacteroidales bacterium]
MSDRLSFHTGINYIQKGSRHNPDYDKGDLDKLIIRLGYVEMPLLYQYKLKSGFFLEAGTSIGSCCIAMQNGTFRHSLIILSD